MVGPLELGEDAEHLDHHPPRQRRGVEGLGRRAEGNTGCVEVFQELGEAAHRPGEPVDPVDEKEIETAGPVLGLIFLAYAEHRCDAVRPQAEAKATARRPVSVDDYRARSVLYVPDEARLSHLVELPADHDLGPAVDMAMRAIETHNPELKDVLPKGYQRLEKSTLVVYLESVGMLNC